MHLIHFVLLAVLPHLLFAAIPFVLNPTCALTECKAENHTAIYYSSQSLDDSTIHLIFSSLDELTISVVETAKGFTPTFDYEALFAKDYSSAKPFNGTQPRNSFSLVLRRLIQYNDSNDNGRMDDNDNETISYPLTDIVTSNVTFNSGNPSDPTFVLPLPSVRRSDCLTFKGLSTLLDQRFLVDRCRLSRRLNS